MRRFNLFLLTIILLALISSPASADKSFLSEYTQTLYNSDSGMGANDANQVLQTRDGYIWIASYSGLIRYDGSEFVRYSGGSKGFTATSATSLFEDARNRLWIGTNEGGLFCRENGAFKKIADPSGSFNSVRSIVSDNNGNIIIGASGGIGRLTDKGIERIPMGKHDTAFVQELACDKENRIWAASRAGEVFVIKDGKLVHVFEQGDIMGQRAQSLAARSDGTILAGMSDSGIALITEEGGKYKFVYYPSPGIGVVNGLYEDRHDRLWVCGDNGLAYYDKSFAFYPVDGSKINSSIEKIFEDYEGDFWISSSRQGLLQLTRNKFRDVNFAASLPSGVVNTTHVYKGLLYVGMDHGLFAINKTWQTEENELTTALEGIRVRNLMEDSKGRLWVSTYKRNGIACLHPDGRIRFISKADGLPDDKVRLAMELRNGDIAVGTNGGLGLIRDGKVVKSVTEADGLTNPTILSMCEDGEGVLYLGSDGGGIFALKDGAVTNYDKKDGLLSGVILRMLYDAESNGIWISTGSHLNFRDSGGAFRPIKLQAPINSGIFDIKKGPKGELMILADTGIHMADPKELLSGGNPRCVSYVKKDGLRSTITANSWNGADKDGTIYLCCADGVYGINLSHVYINKQKPKIAVNKVEVDGEVYENPTKIVLSPHTQRLTLDLAVLSFVNPPYNKAEYYLKGFENEKTTTLAKNLHNISYTNLKGGTYTFVFNALNSDGVATSKPINLVIEKEKRLFEQPVVLILLAFIAAGLIFALTRCYGRRKEAALLKRQEELRAITTQATEAIANTIDAKDPYTKGHSSRVAHYSGLIAKKLGFTQQQLDDLYYTALLHDIGKIGIPDNILNKPAKLTDEEFEIMKQHPTVGGEILKNITVIKEIKDGAEFHHEKYDGSGYNKGLKGDEIPLVARIIGVADAVDAMGSTRPYRTKRSPEYVISELERYSGTQFDPKIAQTFIDLLKNDEAALDEDL